MSQRRKANISVEDFTILPLRKEEEYEALDLSWQLSYVKNLKKSFKGEATHPKSLFCGVLLAVVTYMTTSNFLYSLFALFVPSFLACGYFAAIIFPIVKSETLDHREGGYHYWMESKDITRMFWVARYKGELAGTVAVEVNKDRVAYVQRVAVAPKFGGRGLGKKMMYHCQDYCREQKCSKIILFTSTYQVVAVAMYKKLGYEIKKNNTLGLGICQVCFEMPLL